jgi:hypothetical protein
MHSEQFGKRRRIFLLPSVFNDLIKLKIERLCGLLVRVPGCRSRGPGSITGAT